MALEEGWVSVEEVAAHLQVAKESVYRWIDSKAFPAHRVGRLLRFKLSEVDEWVKAGARGDSASSPTGKAMVARPTARKTGTKKKTRND